MNTSNAPELIPCPFCGQAVSIKKDFFRDNVWHVVCETAGHPSMQSDPQLESHEALDSLIAMWNTRHPVQQAPASDGLRKALSVWKARMDTTPMGHEDKVKGASTFNWMREAYDFFSQYLAQPAASEPSAEAEDIVDGIANLMESAAGAFVRADITAYIATALHVTKLRVAKAALEAAYKAAVDVENQQNTEDSARGASYSADAIAALDPQTIAKGV